MSQPPPYHKNDAPITQTIRVEVAPKLIRVLTTPKRIKIIYGGRGGSKSTAVADAFLKFCDDGERLCAAREFQNSIDESVHSMLVSRIMHHMPDHRSRTVWSNKKRIQSNKGGEIFYRGLAKDPSAIRSMHGVKRIWIEEAQKLSEESITTLTPTIRESESEIWMTLNRGASTDPISKHFLKPYERELARHKFYEDDDIMIVEINYYDNPFFPPVLEQERRRDKKTLSPAKYAHIWLGEYEDTVDNAIITPDWFDACIDAHVKLGIKPEGAEIVAFDPADTGDDDKALAYRHGIVIMDVLWTKLGDINTSCDWALDYAISRKVDEFVWDGDGMGAGLRRQISTAVLGKRINVSMFRGGGEADEPRAMFYPIDGELSKARSNGETFANKRAQYYWMLRDRMFNTYQAIVHKKYVNPEDMISFSSGIKNLDVLRAEICQIPEKRSIGSGRFQVMSKEEMKRPPLRLPSPGGADSVMMSLSGKGILRNDERVNYREHRVIDQSVGY